MIVWRMFALMPVLLFAQTVSVQPPAHAQQANHKRILVLLPSEVAWPVGATMLRGLETGLRSSYSGTVDIVTENVGPTLPEPDDFNPRMAEWMAYKYGQQKLDAIVVVTSLPFHLAESLRDRFWPEAPLVLALVDEEREQNPQSVPRSTRVVAELDIKESLRSALQMLPATRRVVLLSGASKHDQQINKHNLKSLQDLYPRLEIIQVAGLTLEETKARVTALPDQSIIVVGSFYFDRTGERITNVRLVKEVSSAANSPLFYDMDTAMGEGMVGGIVLSLNVAFVKVGEQLARLLNGADPASLPEMKVQNSYIVDWRQLKKWHIPERNLPPGATILYREPTAWEQYRRPIIAVLSLLSTLLCLIAILLFERQRRRKEENLNSAMLKSLPGVALLVTRRGDILRSNQKGSQPANGIPFPAQNSGHQQSYKEYLQKLLGTGTEPDQDRPIQDVISGNRAGAVVEIPSHDGQKWVEIRAIQLQGPKGGSLVVHLDVTQRKLTELEQNKSREEIYHLNRVASMGQLAGSLAHELSQPLAAILVNAQAAQRFAGRSEPDMKEVREALEEITRDDKRARDIIHEMRGMLKKESITRHAVDLNAIVPSLVQIIRSDAQQRGIRLDLDLVTGELMVLGDWAPLQQVLLNLMKNGMEAMAEIPADRRYLTVSTKIDVGAKAAVISVADNGTGVTEEIRARLFEAFVTTKKDGLGMGLSICQSIVQSLGGKIALQRTSGDGATFRVELPLITA
jgi:C4-dicarboxylate-specific signal transduction histidine kinase